MTVSGEHLSELALAAQSEKAAALVEVDALYAHYRDPTGYYKVIGIGTLEATQEPAVIYQKQSGSHLVWIRPLSSWMETVVVDDQIVPRFRKV